MSNFCQHSYHRKCKCRGVGGQNLVNVVCEQPLMYVSSVMLLADGALAHLEFGGSVNPISTGEGADYVRCITACRPGFENLTASLKLIS